MDPKRAQESPGEPRGAQESPGTPQENHRKTPGRPQEDASQAFAKGTTFAKLVRLIGEPLRPFEVGLSKEHVAILRQLPGYHDFDPKLETIQMLKAV